MNGADYTQITERLEALKAKLVTYSPDANRSVLQAAYEFARDRHTGQMRKSGEPYIGHPVEVAHFTADMHLDLDCLCAALLHDVVEDTDTSIAEIQSRFGDQVAFLVDSLTKISKLKFASKEHAQAENVRKLVISMSKDIRVVLIKLADRLHNMCTLQHMSQSGQQRIAQETIDIYAPIAHKLGIHWVKSRLEDEAFRYLEPDAYRALAEKLNVKRTERAAYVQRVLIEVQDVMRQANIACEVHGRPKHLYSIHRKMVGSHTEFENVFDLTAFRVIVSAQNECYEALGQIHAAWKPAPGRFKDYISVPKLNGYQSLHTVVSGPEGQRVEFQIRTREMHEIAEFGVAAHVGYKEGRQLKNFETDQLVWLRQLTEQAATEADGTAFLDLAKADILSDMIYVQTPKGSIMELPKGSTPVDFAYAIHSEVGEKCYIAMVDGRSVPLRHELKNGEKVKIITRPDQRPRPEWLEFVKSSRARTKIRSYISAQRREQSLIQGKALLAAELQKHGLRLDTVTKKGDLLAAAELLKMQSVEQLIIAVGTSKVQAATVVSRIVPPTTDTESNPAVTTARKFGQRIAQMLTRAPAKEVIKVNGLDGATEITYARCCNPVPGDDIVGYVTRRAGIQVHTTECARRLNLNDLQLVDVTWDLIGAGRKSDEAVKRRVTVRVVCKDGPGMLAEMSSAFTSRGVNIANAHCRTREGGVAHNLFEVIVSDSSQLNEAIRQVRKVKGVLQADRVQAGAGLI